VENQCSPLSDYLLSCLLMVLVLAPIIFLWVLFKVPKGFRATWLWAKK